MTEVLRRVYMPVGSKLVFDHMAASVPEIMDGWGNHTRMVGQPCRDGIAANNKPRVFGCTSNKTDSCSQHTDLSSYCVTLIFSL
jgi:hypothetical protein